ncbi:hypothetical protein HaLaN_29022 [Haematococcus lacustris]|uniref:Uncharacterized protein n=1 Tax=Haematococcus lacustris TaxID=44745 RepID=A0A6A0ABV6_HAELA|nr:hypothetical protein HaLaN_29022 [Haematococcus lacustris]
MVLHELGQLPLQLYWLRAACKSWNTAKLSHSDLLMRVIKADVELGRSCQASWSAQFQLAARELMGGEFTLSPDMVLGTKAMEVKWLERWGRRWVGFEGDPRLPETVHRERCSYAAWFKHGDGIGINHMAPHLLNRQLSTEVRTSLTRFRLGNSGLGVEKARFEGVTFIDRTCTRCTEGVVDDAMHFIFECTATSSIREQPEFAMTLQNNNENLHDFMLSPCAPLKSRTPRGGGRPSSLTADGLSGTLAPEDPAPEVPANALANVGLNPLVHIWQGCADGARMTRNCECHYKVDITLTVLTLYSISQATKKEMAKTSGQLLETGGRGGEGP